MKQIYFLLIPTLATLLGCTAAQRSDSSTVILYNTASEARTDAFVVLPADSLRSRFPDLDLGLIALFDEDTPIVCQANDLDQDGVIDEVALVVNLEAGEEKNVLVREWGPAETHLAFPKRTQAELSHKVGGQWEDRKYIGGEFQNVNELRVPDEHTDHSFYIRYEGPGWESDKIGYRFYLDWRDASDIFGKTTPDMVLQKVGLDGFDSYHEMGDWGMDVLKVGESLGIGTLAKWHDGKAERVAVTDSVFCKIVLNGPVESMIRTNYYGWEIGGKKTDVRSELSIAAGSRLTRHQVTLSQDLDSLCTGIVKLDSTVVLQPSNGAWSCLATWGKQSLNQDQLGMAVFYRTADRLDVTTDAHSHVVVLRPADRQLTYYFLGAWEKEPGGITSQEAFAAYLDAVLRELNQPVEVRY